MGHHRLRSGMRSTAQRHSKSQQQARLQTPFSCIDGPTCLHVWPLFFSWHTKVEVQQSAVDANAGHPNLLSAMHCKGRDEQEREGEKSANLMITLEEIKKSACQKISRNLCALRAALCRAAATGWQWVAHRSAGAKCISGAVTLALRPVAAVGGCGAAVVWSGDALQGRDSEAGPSVCNPPSWSRATQAANAGCLPVS